jgi:biofilm PGA synthesis N-glycosyltransferase PgaC
MLTWIFWIALFLTFYTYILFPVILFILVSLRSRKDEIDRGEEAILPSVAVLCAVFNEEKVIKQKVDNFLKLKYGRIKLYIGSDGSSDSTNSILHKYDDNDKISIYEFPRRGKVHVINDLVGVIKEDIVVFTDANSMFESDAVNNLLGKFQNPRIGAVCGKLQLISDGRITGEGFYWKYETAIKKKEDALDCVIGANGAIYAIRKDLLKPLPMNTINDDFTNSMRVLEQGYGIKYAENAIAYEETHQSDLVEFKRHVRDGAGHYRAIIHLYRLLNPLNYKIFFLYVSHRIVRWFVPLFMLIMIIVPIFVQSNIFLKSFFIMEVVFYSVVLIAWITGTKKRYLYFPYYFVYINIALFIGFWRNVLGLQKVTWDSTAR